MALLRRGMINVGLYPIGSAYRLRIPLPNIGECWFTVDYSQNIASFIEELKQEDPFIHEIHSDSPLKLFKDETNNKNEKVKQASNRFFSIISTIEAIMNPITINEGSKSACQASEA